MCPVLHVYIVIWHSIFHCRSYVVYIRTFTVSILLTIWLCAMLWQDNSTSHENCEYIFHTIRLKPRKITFKVKQSLNCFQLQIFCLQCHRQRPVICSTEANVRGQQKTGINRSSVVYTSREKVPIDILKRINKCFTIIIPNYDWQFDNNILTLLNIVWWVMWQPRY